MLSLNDRTHRNHTGLLTEEARLVFSKEILNIKKKDIKSYGDLAPGEIINISDNLKVLKANNVSLGLLMSEKIQPLISTLSTLQVEDSYPSWMIYSIASSTSSMLEDLSTELSTHDSPSIMKLNILNVVDNYSATIDHMIALNEQINQKYCETNKIIGFLVGAIVGAVLGLVAGPIGIVLGFFAGAAVGSLAAVRHSELFFKKIQKADSKLGQERNQIETSIKSSFGI
ncbi:MAG: hypothetical protein H0U75_04000 [Legionella sp.]|nr:hypothetical protein [Legionella sp.]